MRKREKVRNSYIQTKVNQIKKMKHRMDIWKRNRKRLKKLILKGCEAIAYIMEKKSKKEI